MSAPTDGDPLGGRVTVRLPSEQLAQLDRLVEADAYPSRSAVIRAALELWLAIQSTTV